MVVKSRYPDGFEDRDVDRMINKAYRTKNMARNFTTRRDGSFFDESIIEAVWGKREIKPNSPSFRKDTCGANMQRTKYGKTEQFGWEIDHKKPVILGGTDDIDNLQSLQWENNRHKGDNFSNWSCKVRG